MAKLRSFILHPANMGSFSRPTVLMSVSFGRYFPDNKPEPSAPQTATDRPSAEHIGINSRSGARSSRARDRGTDMRFDFRFVDRMGQEQTGSYPWSSHACHKAFNRGKA